MVKVSRISLEKRGLGVLSPLENDVLRVLWRQEDVRVRDIYNVLRKRRKVALTSVAVILDRLHKKGVVKRRVQSGLGGYHYIYSSKADEALFAESV
ncbi:MAG: BlaI/MecI/CopY family transcriptional regulator, partial [Nanoarchaeota archaeon]